MIDTALSTHLSTEEDKSIMVIEPYDKTVSIETNVKEPTSNKPKLPWDKLSKFVQWKLFTAYMHQHNLTDGNLFKRMRSMVSEKRTNAFVEFDIESQQIINVDFKHEVFIRERSKKGKLRVQLLHANEENKIKALEASINGLPLINENIEIIEEEHLTLN